MKKQYTPKSKNPVLQEILEEIQMEKNQKKRCSFPYWGNWGNWGNWVNWGNWINWYNGW